MSGVVGSVANDPRQGLPSLRVERLCGLAHTRATPSYLPVATFMPAHRNSQIGTKKSSFSTKGILPHEAFERSNLRHSPRPGSRPTIFRPDTQAKLYSAVPSYRETEIKLRVDDLVALIGKLKGLGARTNGRVLERNTLFDTPGADFRRLGRLLRLRIETPARSPLVAAGAAGAILTSKQPAPAS